MAIPATERPTTDGKALAIIGRDEMNLAEFALGLASDRNPKDLKTIERFQVIPLPDGRVLEQKWIVTGSDKYGLPRAGDDDVLLGLLKIGNDQSFGSRKVFFSRYDLFQLMDWPLTGPSYTRLQDALDRLAGVRIIARNSFWDNERKSYISTNFGIIDEYQLLGCPRGRKNTEQIQLPFTYVCFSEKLYQSLQAKNIKRLDLCFYYSLKSSVSKRLYRFLSKRRRGRKSFEIEVMALASVNVGLDVSQRKYVSQVKQKLNHAHEELKQHGFLKAWEYRWSENREAWFVNYSFAEGADEERPPAELPASTSHTAPESASTLAQQLVARGFSAIVAQNLVAKYEDRIAAKLEIYDHLLRTNSRLVQRNPVGWLRKAIEDDYQGGPKTHQNHLEQRIREEKNLAQQSNEQQRQIDSERNNLVIEHFGKLPVGEQDMLLEEARGRLEFLPKEKRTKLDLGSPVLRGIVYELLLERYPTALGREVPVPPERQVGPTDMRVSCWTV